MKANKKTTKGITRRDALKVSGVGLAFGGLAMMGAAASNAIGASSSYPPGVGFADKNSYLTKLKRYVPGMETVGTDEMRISFMGSWYSPRIAQACNSIFVEVGPGSNGTKPDQFGALMYRTALIPGTKFPLWMISRYEIKP